MNTKEPLRLPLWVHLMYAKEVSRHIDWSGDLPGYRHSLEQNKMGLSLARSVLRLKEEGRLRIALINMAIKRIDRELSLLDTGVVDYGVLPGDDLGKGAGN